jgi:hypothetical protein
MADVTIENVFSSLEEKYFLIKKKSFWYFLGGAVAFLVACFAISYNTVIKTIEEKTGVETLLRLKSNLDKADSANAKFKSLYNNLKAFDLLTQMPKGTILGWFSNKIPTGWQICNGQNGTPNLKERFPMGTVSNNSLGQTGGSAEHTHISNNLWNDGVQDKWNVNNNHNDPTAAGMLHSHIIVKSSNIPPFTKISFIMKMTDRMN